MRCLDSEQNKEGNQSTFWGREHDESRAAYRDLLPAASAASPGCWPAWKHPCLTGLFWVLWSVSHSRDCILGNGIWKLQVDVFGRQHLPIDGTRTALVSPLPLVSRRQQMSFFCTCTVIWARPPAQAQGQTSPTRSCETQRNSKALWWGGCFFCLASVSAQRPSARAVLLPVEGWRGPGRCSAWAPCKTVWTPTYILWRTSTSARSSSENTTSFLAYLRKEAQRPYLPVFCLWFHSALLQPLVDAVPGRVRI